MDSSEAYQALGILRGATAREVKRAYRKLAKQHHLDRNPGDPEAACRFQQIHDAYAALRSSLPAESGEHRVPPSTPESPRPNLRTRRVAKNLARERTIIQFCVPVLVFLLVFVIAIMLFSPDPRLAEHPHGDYARKSKEAWPRAWSVAAISGVFTFLLASAAIWWADHGRVRRQQ